MTIGKRFVINLISSKVILNGFVKMGPQYMPFRCEVPKKLNKASLNEIIYIC